MKSDSVPAFALEKEALKTEIEAGIQTGVEQIGFSNLSVGLADELKHLLNVISVSLDGSCTLSVCGQIIDVIVIHFYFLHFLIAYTI